MNEETVRAIGQTCRPSGAVIVRSDNGVGVAITSPGLHGPSLRTGPLVRPASLPGPDRSDPRCVERTCPPPTEGLVLTHFLTVRDVARSRDFYADILGGEVVLEENPAIVKVANTWIIMNSGGGPTPDKPDVTPDCSRASSPTAPRTPQAEQPRHGPRRDPPDSLDSSAADGRRSKTCPQTAQPCRRCRRVNPVLGREHEVQVEQVVVAETGLVVARGQGRLDRFDGDEGHPRTNEEADDLGVPRVSPSRRRRSDTRSCRRTPRPRRRRGSGRPAAGAPARRSGHTWP